MSFIRPVLLFFGCLHLTIGSANCLQLVAWAAMLMDYSQDRSLVGAAGMTFDGEHPCSLCLALAENREKEKSDPVPHRERQAERHELFPQEELQPRHRRTLLSASSPPAPTVLLGAHQIFPKLPTPPPRGFCS